MNTVQKNKISGSVLGLVVCAMVILVVLGVGYMSLGMNSRLFTIRDATGVVARSAADAGLTRCVYELNAELFKIQEPLIPPPWETPSDKTGQPLENCNATYDYTIRNPNGTGPGTDPLTGFRVSSTGNSNGTVKVVKGFAKLRTTQDRMLQVKTNIILKNGSTINRINADAIDVARGFQIGTDSTKGDAITLNNNVTVNADIIVGVGGVPSSVIKGNGDVNGLAYAATTPYPWIPDPVIAPSGLPNMGSINGGGTISSSGQYSSINIPNGQTLIINQPVTLYVTGGITLGNGSELQIASGGQLNLYLGNAMAVGDKNGALINNVSQDARMLKIWGLPTCTDINLRVNGTFYGEIWAPEAAVTTFNSYPFVGAVAAKSFEQKAKADFIYDANLRDVTSIFQKGIYFEIEQWQEN